MKKYPTLPEIAEIVRHFMPKASDEELKEATINFQAYLGVLAQGGEFTNMDNFA